MSTLRYITLATTGMSVLLTIITCFVKYCIKRRKAKQAAAIHGPQLPGAGRTSAWHHHGSHTPASPRAI